MKEINVDTRKYVKAPIDGKNVVEESLLDAIFDDSQYLSNKFSLGFVGGEPTMIESITETIYLSRSYGHVVRRSGAERLSND